MEDFPTHVIHIIASVVIVAGVIAFGFLFYQQNNSASYSVQKAAINQKNSIKEQKYQNYNDKNFTGSGILRTIKLFQNEKVSIRVQYGADTYDTFLYELNADGTIGAKKPHFIEDYENAKYQLKRNDISAVHYISSDQEYTANLIISDVGSITGIQFDLKI